MKTDERDRIAVELCRLWPKKYEDSELRDFCDRVMTYRAGDILSAINEHKNSKPFSPKVNEILGRLRGKEQRDRVAGDEGSFSDVTRRVNVKEGPGQYAGVADPYEVTLRYWRSCWFRYALDAGKRKPEKENSTFAMFESQWNGMAKKCRVGCVNSLCSQEMTPEDAETYAAYVFKEPEDFRLALMQLRGEVPVDPFDPFESEVA